MTPAAEPNLDDADINNKVLVTDGPTDEADDPKGSNDQPTKINDVILWNKTCYDLEYKKRIIG